MASRILHADTSTAGWEQCVVRFNSTSEHQGQVQLRGVIFVSFWWLEGWVFGVVGGGVDGPSGVGVEEVPGEGRGAASLVPSAGFFAGREQGEVLGAGAGEGVPVRCRGECG